MISACVWRDLSSPSFVFLLAPTFSRQVSHYALKFYNQMTLTFSSRQFSLSLGFFLVHHILENDHLTFHRFFA